MSVSFDLGNVIPVVGLLEESSGRAAERSLLSGLIVGFKRRMKNGYFSTIFLYLSFIDTQIDT